MPELEKVKCSTPDFAKENAKKLLALFPECEGQKGEVDLDKLRQVLSSTAIEGNVERYQFTWPGKRNAMAAASAATTKTLRPCAAESVGRDGTPGGFDSENLYIEGDNLEVLKLLQTSYANQVKMIYIDPPYNTGHDFVYRDRFSLTQKELDDNAGAFDEDGNRFEVNDSAEARYHSNWCSMMYPRLKLARNLLRDDGVIFISIDDNEVANLRKLCDEIFGESNLLAQCVRKRRDSQANLSKNISPIHEYVVVYAKQNGDVLNKVSASIDESEYKNPDNDPRGPYKTMPCTNKGGAVYSVSTPSGRVITDEWRFKKDTYDKLLSENRLVFPRGGEGKPRYKLFLSEKADEGQLANTWLDTLSSNQEATREIKALFDDKGVFDAPKPVGLLRFCLELASEKDSLILDFFSGSATTAHAVMKLNAEDDGNRKFIMVQLPEVIDPEKLSGDAKKTAQAAVELLDSIGKPHVICEIAKERIRRAGKKIAGENATTAPNLDIGFRVLKLDSSSLRDTSATVSETNQEFANFERVRSDRSAEDLLFQMLLETNIPLSEPIVKTKVGGNNVFFVGCTDEGTPLVACLDAKSKMTTKFFLEIAKLKPELAFFRDDTFVDDSARTNLQQAFNQFSPTTSIKVI